MKPFKALLTRDLETRRQFVTERATALHREDLLPAITAADGQALCELYLKLEQMPRP
jgi:hypothetical protein